MERQH